MISRATCSTRWPGRCAACCRAAGLPELVLQNRFTTADFNLIDHSFPSSSRKRRAVRGKKRGCKCAAEDSPSSSWPGLSRPSTPCRRKKKGVDARHKAGHDDGGLSNSLRRLV